MVSSLRIRCQHATACYNATSGIWDVSAAFRSGQLIAVVGDNGSGKSTLLKAINKDIPLSGGCIDFRGVSPHEVAYLPQSPNINRDFPITVRDFVAMGAWRTVGGYGGFPELLANKIDVALQESRLLDLADRYIGDLSGGQFQRTLFARITLQESPIVLLDEPFVGVDETTATLLLNVLQQWREEGRCILVAIHDLNQVGRYFTHAIAFNKGYAIFGLVEQILTTLKKGVWVEKKIVRNNNITHCSQFTAPSED